MVRDCVLSKKKFILISILWKTGVSSGTLTLTEEKILGLPLSVTRSHRLASKSNQLNVGLDKNSVVSSEI
jgi:hypothetical protein